MRTILIVLVLYLPFSLFSQNLKQILNQSETDSLSNGYEIFKYTDRYDDLSGFEGKLRIKSVNSKLKSCSIGEWKSFYEDSQKLKASFEFDSLGCMITYSEYTEEGVTNFYCDYVKVQINNENYLLATIKFYFDNGGISEIRRRAYRFDYKYGYYHLLDKSKIGLWVKYNYDGTIEKRKQYRDIE